MRESSLIQFEKMFREMIKNATLDGEGMSLRLVAGDNADLAMDEREKALSLKLQGRDRFYLKKVQDGLERIKDGTFGTCEECEQGIEEGRLFARPTATLCITCKEEQEKVEGQILYENKSHTHGKTFANSNVVDLANLKPAEEADAPGNVIAFPTSEENRLA